MSEVREMSAVSDAEDTQLTTAIAQSLDVTDSAQPPTPPPLTTPSDRLVANETKIIIIFVASRTASQLAATAQRHLPHTASRMIRLFTRPLRTLRTYRHYRQYRMTRHAPPDLLMILRRWAP
ncbi:hypothetical protein OAO87_01610 [bacterium]|nr:hypothetical protein [bacterium]